MIEDLGENNEVICPEGFDLSGKILGSNNIITIGESKRRSSAVVTINGDNNTLSIGENTALTKPHIYIGNHIVKAHRVSVSIGPLVSTAPACAISCSYPQMPGLVTMRAPSTRSARRAKPRQMTVAPGGGSAARSRYPPRRAIALT